ncbi:uncharacterized protein LOC133185143 [Saccostrea echinata]|uniref:uncharacterized protein LOC133185143 n=1 Tax=Saccostrea echinata TaxID=191078 RepID=UPI002A7FA43D|nr:uncharacterized protein LOC133185143 [Saccostrea echinata]
MDTNPIVKFEIQDEEKSTRFRTPVTDEELNKLVPDQENANTKSNTKWAMNEFEEWRENRDENIPELHVMDSKEMGYWLERFVVEMRKKDGTEYPPKSIYLILCGLLRHLRDKGIYDKNFLNEKNTEFAGFRKIADAQMRNLIDKGLGCDIKCADPILPEQEEKLWEKGVFGQENREQLQLTMFFGGLRGCDEHYSLTAEQFFTGADEYGKYIKFVGRSSKTYKGGLGQSNVQNKNIKHYSDPGERCIIDFFDAYLKAIGGGPFYRRPLPPLGDVKIRYSHQNVGINKLKNFMKVIAEKGDLSGNFTNHSGKRTCATQMYIAGVPEQEIMKRPDIDPMQCESTKIAAREC